MAQKHYDKRFRPGQPQHQQQQQNQQPALSPADMQTGLVALLDRFVAAETTSTADKETLHHARELRNRLAARPHTSSVNSRRELDVKRPDKSTPITIPPYVHRTVTDSRDLPPLPPIAEPALHDAVFTHRSFYAKSGEKTVYTDLDLDYERLEFLGDAYIELIASHALYNRFPHVDVPQLCSWRERLVENSALGKFSAAYGFPDRLRHLTKWDPASKAWKKVVADIFEAYVAGIVLSDPAHGYTTAEAWLTALWAPQLLSFKEKPVANPAAKNDLARLLTVHDTRVEYRDERPMTYDADHLQHYYLGAYLTGWGYENEWLGSGEGQKRADAALAAAADAIQRNGKVLQDASRKKSEMLARVKKEKEEKARVEGSGVKREREGGDEGEKKRKKRDVERD
jgi:ribonuclease-3